MLFSPLESFLLSTSLASSYDVQELSQSELLGKIALQLNNLGVDVAGKLDIAGDFKGTWEGLAWAGSDAGLSAEVVDARGTFATLLARLNDMDSKNSFGVILIQNYPKIVPETDDTGRILRAVSDAQTTHRKLVFEPYTTYYCSSTIRFYIGDFAVDGQGATLDFTAMPSGGGYALELTGNPSTDFYNGLYPIKNLYLNGKTDDTWLVDGIFFGTTVDNTVDPAWSILQNVKTHGFRDAISFGDNTWLNTFINCTIGGFTRYGIDSTYGVNAGENIRFFGGLVYDGTNTAKTAVALHAGTPHQGDVAFFGTSFDYNDIQFDISSGRYSFFGCHFENNTVNPVGKATTSASYSVVIDIIGCSIGICGPMGVGTEPATGRPHIFEVDATNGPCAITIKGGGGSLYGRTSEVVHVNGGYPAIEVDFNPEVQTGQMPTICSATSEIYNGDFETGGIGGWTFNASSGYTQSVDNTVAHGGTNSLKMVSASGYSASVVQSFNVKPAKTVFVKGFIKTNLTGGSGCLLIKYLAKDGTVIGQRNAMQWIAGNGNISGVTDWTEVSDKFIPPAGTEQIQVQCFCSSATGTVWFDDVMAWTI